MKFLKERDKVDDMNNYFEFKIDNGLKFCLIVQMMIFDEVINKCNF